MFQIHSLKRWLFTFYSLLYLILKYLELETKLDFKKNHETGCTHKNRYTDSSISIILLILQLKDKGMSEFFVGGLQSENVTSIPNLP